jgi:TetR/AcrR family transcriptional regulator
MKKDKPTVRKDGALTRENILLAAAQEFSTKGLAGARVDVIAAVSGANKSLLYQYYVSKEGLFAAVLERYYDIIRQGDSEADNVEDPAKALHAIVISTYDAWLKIPEFISILSSENLLEAKHVKRLKKVIDRYQGLIQTIDGILKRGAKTGAFRPGIDARQLYVTIAALTTYHISNKHTLSALLGTNITSKAALKQRREHAADIVLRYVASDRA